MDEARVNLDLRVNINLFNLSNKIYNLTWRNNRMKQAYIVILSFLIDIVNFPSIIISNGEDKYILRNYKLEYKIFINGEQIIWYNYLLCFKNEWIMCF